MLRHLEQKTGKAPPREGLCCMALTHNEGKILPDFLRHYRELGIDHFLIVDDRSTDETADILDASPDVTVFHPADGTSYKEHKRFWRAEVLDTFSAGRWVIVPDIDEHLILPPSAGSRLPNVIEALEAEGADALHATMVDMYRDAPLADHAYSHGKLVEAFPLFDGPDNYFRLPVPKKNLARYPTPIMMVVGGMRQRVFRPFDLFRGDLLDRTFRRIADIGGSLEPRPAELRKSRLVRLLMQGRVRYSHSYNMSKIPLLKWRQGLYFHGGAHTLSQRMNLSSMKAALLHFNFASGLSGVERRIARGQHARGSRFYRKMTEQADLLRKSPVFDGTLQYDGPSSLGRLLSGIETEEGT
ncbi:MAG: glycosyltransferase family 2 protein [Verrucomicrobiota bacterium]